MFSPPVLSVGDGEPRLLERVPGGVFVAGDAARIAPERLLPFPDEIFECLGISFPAPEHKQLVLDLVAAVSHFRIIGQFAMLRGQIHRDSIIERGSYGLSG